MKLAGALLALVCVTGCGGTVILHSDNHRPAPRPAPAPAPVPCHDCRNVSRDEAAHIVAVEARRHHVGRVRVEEVERKDHDWRVEARGVDECGHRVEVRARVDRRTGDIERFDIDSKEHRKDRKHRNRHDDDDD